MLERLWSDAGLASIAHDVTGTANDVTYGLDAHNPSSQVTQRSTGYDGHGRLISYSQSGTISLAHSYNGLGDRTATTATPAGGSADTRRFVTAPDGRIVGEYGSSATDVKAEFIWLSPQVGDTGPFGGDDGLGGYMPIAMVNGTTLSWVHGDHLGTPIVMTDATGTAIAQPSGYYAAAFPGQSKTLADLYYNRHRDYDPTTGRYIQADPIGLAGGSNPYSYAMGNPLRYVDPLGLAAWPASLDPSGFGPPMLRPNEPIRPVDWTRPTPFMLQRPKKPCPEPVPPPPPPNWCGSDEGDVPDGTWPNACKTHDECYGTRGANKEMCDLKLTRDITSECSTRTSDYLWPVCAMIGVGYGGGLMISGYSFVDCGGGRCTRIVGPSRRAYDRAQ